MKAAIDQFRVNISRARNLGAVYKAINAQTTGALDLSDILRAELVMGVSALDQYIHELTRLGMLDSYYGRRVKTSAFSRFQVPLESALQGISLAVQNNIVPLGADWLEEQIRIRHGYQSFQQPDKIAEAIRLISDVSLWQEVAIILGMSQQDCKRQLQLIVERRNRIAHESDIDISAPNALWPIDENMVDDVILFIERVAEAIYTIL